MIRLNNKVIMITGATGGLGQPVTAVFSNAGATVVVVERQPSKSLPDGVLGFTADVTNESDVQRVVTEVKNKTKRIDCVINLVGGFAMGRLTETNASDWSKMLTLNLTAAFLLSRAVVPSMIEQGSGRMRHFGIMVRDQAQIEEVKEKLTKKYGLTLEPHFQCDFRDPWGNRIQVGDLHDESLVWLLPYREVQDTGITFTSEKSQA